MPPALMLTAYALLWASCGALVALSLSDLWRIFRGLRSNPMR